ncbi:MULTISPECIES: intermembrane transport protein PqiB [Paraburkholderia]|uniref:Paraquat-inducible protein B n=3 Tax=Burkholderiaceae TaxID=119060 RepID=A0A1A5X7C2_9BURK|nr:MlaD family protein [Paraburkholderia tropica]MBB2979749.1 paraquat-inducible protein B [Paraburkholderia tropica]MBB3000652.1 paraquat-inducible protein B [Paraburkholderia tropica]MBB6320281.1 paraquat-inducible protein B [Paraburkholderia tropica]MDE1143772.1 MlaD family protein [Paraburkholderia tropica]OBR49075.1 mammalian cell entry protein [Paraburkholderia tropica]
MPDSGPDGTLPDLPEAKPVAGSRWRMQIVWLVPVVALLIGGWLAAKAILEEGPTVTISFRNGDGLEAGKTKIKYKDVDIGIVKSVTLSPDHKRVIATGELVKDATSMLVANTRFWVVRPRISGGTVSGLGTLLSGSYVGMDEGNSKSVRRDFVGLEVPPVFPSDMPGREFVLKSADMGSLDVGSPVFFRRLEVGQIASYELDPNGKGVTLHVFVNAPYDRYVRGDTRFWHASGLDVSLSPDGVQINTQSFVSLLIGGIAFETPDTDRNLPEVADNTPFDLYATRAEAMKQHDRIVDTYIVTFFDSVRGLTVGAPVDFRGVEVGEVTHIYTRFDPVKRQFSIPVEISLYPERFTLRYRSNARQEPGGRLTSSPHELADFLIASGFRFQLRSGNPLTGQLYVAFDMFPDSPKAKIDWSRTPPELPTVPRTLQSLQDSLTRLLAKLNGIPFEQIGTQAQQTLQNTNEVIARLGSDVVPEAQGTLSSARTALDSANSALQPDTQLQQNTSDAMRELARTAASMRNLTDYLERHPEAVVRGKPGDKP